MRYFFYGTLLDADVRAWILGGWIGRRVLLPAVLPNYHRVCLRGRDYPVVVPARGQEAPGVLALGFDRQAAANLAAFESDEYVAADRPVRLADGAVLGARVFLASRLARPTGRDWCVSVWQREHKAAFARRHKAPFTGREEPGRQRLP